MDNLDQIMTHIRETQASLERQNDTKDTLQKQLKVVEDQILTDIATLGSLQDALNKALSAANKKAAEDGGACDTAEGSDTAHLSRGDAEGIGSLHDDEDFDCDAEH